LVNIVDPITGKIPITINYGQHSFGNDLGAYKLSNIGDRAWADENNNGVQDAGELGLEGVVFNLYNCDDNFIARTTSLMDGSYSFTGIAPGSYYICVETAPNGYLPTQVVAMDNNSFVNANGCSDCVSLLDETTIDDLDAGFIFGSSDIGDRLWFDENENGVDDPGEPGLAGVILNLQDCNGTLISTVTTDVNGNYLFSDVLAGNYVICIEEDYREYRISSDLIINGTCTECFSHDGQDNDLDFDFELIYEKAVVDTKTWIDENGNGIREDDEPLVEGIRTEIYTCDDVLVATDFTDDIGGAWFENLCVGEYYIRVYLDDEYDFITNGGRDNISSTTKIGTSDCFSVLGIGRTLDVGLKLANSGQEEINICSTVWNDANENGLIDASEQNISGLQIDIYNCVGLFVASLSTTDTDILCSVDLEEGEYYLYVNVPNGYELTIGSEITGINGPGTTECFLIDETTTINLGVKETSIVTPGGLDAILFEDTNGNGFWDVSEPVFSNTVVNLYDCDRNFISTMNTDVAGTVWFGNVPVGGYIIEVATIDGFDFISNGEITNANGIGTTDCFQVGATGRTIHAGYTRGVTVTPGGLDAILFEDANGSGFWETSEPVFSNTIVNLYDCDRNLIATMNTDAAGTVWFGNVPTGNYIIEASPIDGFDFISNGEISNANGIGTTDCFQLGATGRTVHAGYTPIGQSLIAAINGSVWFDENQDGFMNNSEVKMKEVTVRLYDSNFNVIETIQTDLSGDYTFGNLTPGDYFIQFDSPSGYSYTSYSMGSNSDFDSEVFDMNVGMTQMIEFTAQGDLDHVNAGLVIIDDENASISGKVWIDENINNVEDLDEMGYRDLSVSIHDADGFFLDITFTDAAGRYRFENLTAGRYYLDFEQPLGFELSQFRIGSDPSVDSDVSDLLNGTTDYLTVLPGDNLEYINLGLQPEVEVLGSLSGQVWLDIDLDGLIGATEVGINQIEVTLFDNNKDVVSSTFTNPDGIYTFENKSH